MNNIFIGLLIFAIVEFLLDVIKKAPFELLRIIISSYLRLIIETIYLSNILKNDRFRQWRPNTGQYIALQTIKTQFLTDISNFTIPSPK